MDLKQALKKGRKATIQSLIENRNATHECKTLTFSNGYIIVAGIALNAPDHVDPTVAYTGHSAKKAANAIAKFLGY